MAGKIPQNFIDDVLARVDIVEVIDSYVPLRKAGKDHKALCPFHEEKTPSFTVSQSKQIFHCFGCNAGGTVIGFLMEYNGMNFVEAIEDLAERCSLEMPRDSGYQPDTTRHNELYDLLEQVAKFYQQQLREHGGKAIDYLKNRGITGVLARDYEIGYAPSGWQNLVNALGKSEAAKTRLEEAGVIKHGGQDGYYDLFRERIMFPIRNSRGRVIGFGGRVLDDATPKYINTPETPIYHKGSELYGLYQARRRGKQPEQLYIVEGYMDVIALAQHGISNAVATLGTAATDAHLKKLYRVADRLIFCFDGDTAGKNAAWRALEIAIPHLSQGKQALFHFLPEGDDPDSFVRQHGREVFQSGENTIPLSDFLLDSIKSRAKVSTREGRAKFLDLILPHLARMPESGLRELLLEDIAKIAQIDAGGIGKLLQHQLPGTTPRRKAPRPPTRRGKTSLVSALISCILFKPELARSEDSAELSGISVPGVDFLIELIDLIHSNPEINCARILEHWRDTPYEQRLAELAADPGVLGEKDFDLERQFSDSMNKLKAFKAREAVARIAPKKPSELTEEDKATLRRRYSKNSV